MEAGGGSWLVTFHAECQQEVNVGYKASKLAPVIQFIQQAPPTEGSTTFHLENTTIWEAGFETH